MNGPLEAAIDLGARTVFARGSDDWGFNFVVEALGLASGSRAECRCLFRRVRQWWSCLFG